MKRLSLYVLLLIVCMLRSQRCEAFIIYAPATTAAIDRSAPVPAPASVPTSADTRLLSGRFYSKPLGVKLHLNLFEANLEAPGYSFLGPMHGYIEGGIYGTWMITRFTISQKGVRIRFINDIGSETQEVDFSPDGEGRYVLRTVGSNAFRKAVGRKLVKVDDVFVFERQGEATAETTSP